MLKVMWGTVICVVSWIMISFAGGIDGIKILGNLGGLPALFIVGGSVFSLYKIKILLVDEAESTATLRPQPAQQGNLSAGLSAPSA